MKSNLELASNNGITGRVLPSKYNLTAPQHVLACASRRGRSANLRIAATLFQSALRKWQKQL